MKNRFISSKQQKKIIYFNFTGETVLNFLNENWKTVAEEFGKPIVDYSVNLAITTIEKFFLAVPYEELINVPLPK